jgi:hypothetical protein
MLTSFRVFSPPFPHLLGFQAHLPKKGLYLISWEEGAEGPEVLWLEKVKSQSLSF